jgi:5-methylthioribose kinase
LLEQIAAIWTSFSAEFAQLWRGRATPGQGDLCKPRLAVDAPAFEATALAARLEAVWQDALGFAGCEMIRRIVGLAHVEDFEAIAAPETRARCERHAIELARELLLQRTRFGALAHLIEAASMVA